MLPDKQKLERILTQDLGLTPYESKAYIALIIHGPMSPSDLNQKAGIPRPRTYDVLNSLVGKGLLLEQPGRPPVYEAIEPKHGLKNLLLEIEKDALAQLEEKRKIVYTIAESLMPQYRKEREALPEGGLVWVTRRDTALLAKYADAIRNIENELVVLSNHPRPPEKEILEAVKDVLKEKKTVRVVRRITEQWTAEDIENYEKVLKLGSQVRQRDEITIRYSIFDKKSVVFWLPENNKPTMSLIAVWVTSAPLAEILYDHFERLWNQSQPILPKLESLKKRKTMKERGHENRS